MIRGVLIAFGTYALFSFADACIKASGGQLSVVQITFVATLFSTVVVYFAKPRTERWTDMLRMHRPGLVLLRAAAGIGAGLFSAMAFTTLPLADAYSLLFLMPVFVAGLSFVLLGEKLGWKQISSVLVGLTGVLLVVRPGFKEILPGHFAGVATAICGAATLLILRKIGRTERQVSLIGTLMLGTLLVTGVMTIFVYETPSWTQFGLLASCGIFAGFAHLGLMAATRYAPANRVGPIQYSQIVWAALLGALFFAEFPDWISLCGMTLVAVSGLFAFLRDETPKAIPAEAA